MRCASLCLAILLVAQPAVAQRRAGRTSPPKAPAPTVIADTIYRLAVDSSKHPELDRVLLLDDGVVTLEADGRSVRTFRQVTQVLRESAIEDFAERQFTWSPQRRRLTINWIRVVTPDGHVISGAPTQVQDSDAPAALGNPVYEQRKIRRVSLTGVRVGSIVDISTTETDVQPVKPGDFFLTWGITTGTYVARSRYVVDAPRSLALNIHEAHLTFPRITDTVGTRVRRSWITKDVARVKGERFAALDSSDAYMSLRISAAQSWSDVARWYANGARGRDVLGPIARDTMQLRLRTARSARDTVLALHKWIAQDVRYVSIALGEGTHVPRATDDVMRTGYGDCKDKATLFVAAMRAIGREAYPVLLSSTGGVARDQPSVLQFDHEIAAYREGSDWRFVDLTAGAVAPGVVPGGEQGGFALIVRDDGNAEEVTLPRDDTADSTVTLLTGSLDTLGLLAGTLVERYVGDEAGGIRVNFEQPLDSVALARVTRTAPARFFPNAIGTSLDLPDGKNVAVEPRVQMRFTGGRVAKRAGSGLALSLPFFASMEGQQAVADELEQEPRRHPIRTGGVLGTTTRLVRAEITLPDGWRAQLPRDVNLDGPFGQFRTTYRQDGRVLRMERLIQGRGGVLPKERIGELTSFLRAVAADDAGFVLVTPGS
jgi:transglutaminase-like putative cysteine protease